MKKIKKDWKEVLQELKDRVKTDEPRPDNTRDTKTHEENR